MIFLVHYSVLRGPNGEQVWEKVEAVDEPDAMEKIYEKEGFENVNYFMSVNVSS